MQLSGQSLKLLDSLVLRAKRSFYGLRQGAHRSRRRGHGIEFAEYRQYELGDNPRAIDWNLYSRSDKLYVKRYLEEENVALYIVIDGSRSLTHRDLSKKWELASYIAACAGYIGLATQDPVEISVLGGPSSPRYWGGRAFANLTKFLAETTDQIVSASNQELDLVRAAKTAAARVGFPGICLIISDFLYPMNIVSDVLAPFRAQNMEIHAIQVLGGEDSLLGESFFNGMNSGATLIDSETGNQRGVYLGTEAVALYQKLLSEHLNAVRHHCLSAGISYVSAPITDQDSAQEVALSTVSQMGLFT